MKSEKSLMLVLFLFTFLLSSTSGIASVVNSESDFVIIEPSSPSTDDDVVCRASDGDYYFFAWLVNGILKESNSVSATSLTLDSSETSENDILTCIIYFDQDHSIELGRKSVTVASEQIPEPTSKEVEITPSIAYTDDDLVCDVVTDDDLYYYVWQINDIIILTEQSSQKTSTLSSSYTTKHDSVKCLAYYDESHTYEAGEDTVEILNSKPVAVLEVNTTSALFYEDIFFDASASYDVDDDELTYSWDFGDGTSRTEKQVVHYYTEPGNYEVILHVSDGESTSSASKVITIQAPPSKEVEITPSIAYTDDNLICDVVTDDDLYYYVWQVNDITKLIEQSSQKSSTLSSSYTTKHDSVKCLAYYDGSHTYEAGDDTVEILNSKPVAVLEVNTTSALVYEDILFDASASYDPDDDELTYEWDFGDGTSRTEEQVVHSYSEPGEYEVQLTVSDGESTSSASKVIEISGYLVIEEANCFDPVMINANQSCSVVVVDNSGKAMGNSKVEIFDSSNDLLASCTTDSLSGGCSASFITSELGENDIKIIASKEGYGSSEPLFLIFEVLKQRYELHDFAVFNDSAYSKEDDTFYRGENLYTKFRVYDILTETYVSEDIVTSASLISYDAGGNIDLVRDEEADSSEPAYFHFKTTIPLTHFFFGDSAVFAFAINFSDKSMGQADKEIEILNNPPQIEDFSDITFTRITQTETIDLTEYATDLEDPDDLTWEVLSYDSDLLNLELDDSILTISPAAYTKATTNVGLAVYDLDEDSASSTIKVILNIEEPNNPPIITVEGSLNKTIAEGENLNFVVNFFDEDSDPLDISIEGKPYNADFQPLNLLMPNASDITYLFSWTPDYNQSGNYEIKLIANDGKDTTEVIINIRVDNTNRAPVAVLEVNTTSALVYEDILFDASASNDPDGDELTYSWDFGDGTSSTAEQVVHSYSTPGEYEVQLTVSDGESISSASQVIEISGYLVIKEANCFDPVMINADQVCSV
ncbi:MAG: large repetitive protein, partial [Candidatus Woesearchaeota archaeon]|nr:large repetitive protein [Candidatus Woesearchaeota archaeon]